MIVLLCLFLVVTVLTVNYFVERRGGVKFKLMFEAWLIAGKRWLNGDRNASQCVRYASISYETLGTGAELTGEDFQNTETFIVVRSSVFGKSSAHKMHLARDAYHRILGFSRTKSRAILCTGFGSATGGAES